MTENTAECRPLLSDPIWTVEHVAAAFAVSVETGREYANRADFPPARTPGTRLLWARAEVLAWFEALPARTPAERRRSTVEPPAAPVPAPRVSYRPRRNKAVAA
jgi:predicted DNA-binding transcriptional regulator AlpA